MPFKLPDSYYERQKEIYNLKYINYNGKEIHITKLKDKSVTSEMKKEMRMNSYAQDDLYLKLTDEALIDTAKYYLSQCSRVKFPCATYDESLIHKILPEFIKRMEGKL